jgi:hypothetical protein
MPFVTYLFMSNVHPDMWIIKLKNQVSMCNTLQNTFIAGSGKKRRLCSSRCLKNRWAELAFIVASGIL